MVDRQVGDEDRRPTHQEQAYKAGRDAHKARTDRDDLPAWTDTRRSLAKAWVRGWDDAAAEARAATPPPVYRAPEPRPLHPLALWPPGKALPTHYVRPPVPCPADACRRLLTDDGGRAAVLRYVGPVKAGFRCRCCGHRWELPVRR